jgi:hypothetical protein
MRRRPGSALRSPIGLTPAPAANADNGSSNMSQLPARAFGQVAESQRKK